MNPATQIGAHENVYFHNEAIPTSFMNPFMNNTEENYKHLSQYVISLRVFAIEIVAVCRMQLASISTMLQVSVDSFKFVYVNFARSRF